MKTLAVALALASFASSAWAQSRPSTLSMTCAQAAGLVAARGAIVLGTGTYTYDRYVSTRTACLRDEFLDPQCVPTRDSRQCFIGYRCRTGPKELLGD
jgi:hypothetical protein